MLLESSGSSIIIVSNLKGEVKKGKPTLIAAFQDADLLEMSSDVD